MSQLRRSRTVVGADDAADISDLPIPTLPSTRSTQSHPERASLAAETCRKDVQAVQVEN